MSDKCAGCSKYQECHGKAPEKQISNIKNKILVMSGKGGVGKSTVAVNLAVALSNQGYKTGLMDIDLHGPSIPTLLGLEGELLEVDENVLYPIEYNENLKVVSIGLLLQDPDSALIWRGPAKYGVIKQFIEDVQWGELDYLIVDCPPGTGDEPLSVIQELEPVTGAIVVTTPQQLSISDVRKSINFCKEMEVPVIGVIENMSGFSYEGKVIDIFKSGGGSKMAQEMGVSFLGNIPFEPQIVECCDEGKSVVNSQNDAISNVFSGFLVKILEFCKEKFIKN